MQPLKVDVRQWGMPEGIGDNIRYSLTLGLPELQIGVTRHDGTFVICASGPSIQDHIEEIRQDQKDGKAICAVKGAYDYLRGHGITPDLYLSVEPRYRPVRDPSERTTFLLASRVCRQVFDELKNHRIVLWHSWSEGDGMELIQNRMIIGGGTTSGLRAINVGHVLGFHKFKLYGFDSSLGNKGEKRVGQDPLGESVKTIEIVVDGCETPFTTNMAMCAQADDFQSIWDVMPEISVEVIGDGLIPEIWKQRKAKGFKV